MTLFIVPASVKDCLPWFDFDELFRCLCVVVFVRLLEEQKDILDC